MELLRIEKGIEEQMPLIVAGCMALKGTAVEPRRIETLLERNNFDGFDLDQILDVASYASAVDFIGSCKEQKYKAFSGNLVMALANFLLRRIAVKEGFIREGVDIVRAASDLNDIFAEQQSRTLPDFLRVMTKDFMKLQLLTKDNEAMLYLIVNFYLYSYKDRVLAFANISDDAEGNFAELKDWISKSEG